MRPRPSSASITVLLAGVIGISVFAFGVVTRESSAAGPAGRSYGRKFAA